MIHVVDYGVCNIGSILNMLRRLGLQAGVAGTAEQIDAAERLILPGVGAFDAGMRNLTERGLVEALHRAARERRVPILGICLGMQLMGSDSTEGSLPGLGWVDARVRHFTEIATVPTKGIKFPHIGWNFVDAVRPHRLLEGIEQPARFYFVHGYCVVTAESETLAYSSYAGIRFAAMLQGGNVVGAQFHPEKSHRFGMRLLSNFDKWHPEPK